MAQLVVRSKHSSFHPKVSLYHLLMYLRRITHPNASLEEADVPPRTTDVPDWQSPPIDPDALCEHLVELVRQLRPLLPGSYEWLDEGSLEVIGEYAIDAGGVADVWAGMIGNRKVAVKAYRCYSSSDYLPTYMRFYKEASACSCLRSQNIVPFIGVYSTPKHPLALVFELMDHLNLRDYLRNNGNVGRLELLLEVARGVEYMHKLDILHKNLKITNILVGPDGHARVAGLGVAFISSPIPGVDIDRLFHGAAPELVDPRHLMSSENGATKASDVYAFGVLAWETFAGQVPFPNESNVAAVFSMWKGRRLARPDHPEISDQLWKAIKGCWKADPAQRKTIIEIVTILEAEVAAHRSGAHMLRQGRT